MRKYEKFELWSNLQCYRRLCLVKLVDFALRTWLFWGIYPLDGDEI